jgi:hypothetical protein
MRGAGLACDTVNGTVVAAAVESADVGVAAGALVLGLDNIPGGGSTSVDDWWCCCAGGGDGGGGLPPAAMGTCTGGGMLIMADGSYLRRSWYSRICCGHFSTISGSNITRSDSAKSGRALTVTVLLRTDGRGNGAVTCPVPHAGGSSACGMPNTDTGGWGR